MSILNLETVKTALWLIQENVYDGTIDEYIAALGQNYTIDYGETKVVILHDDWDFVLKVPRYYKHHVNYCQREVQNYEQAAEWDVQAILLPTWYVTNCDGLEIYAQTKMSISHSDFMERQALVEKNFNSPLVKEYGRKLNYISPSWIDAALKVYGTDFMNRLSMWILYNDITDLHRSNLAWKQTIPVIMDYAGFDGDTTYYSYTY